MRIVITRRASEQLDAAYGFLASENLSAARRQQESIIRAINQLADFPETGRPGRIVGTREFIIQRTPHVAAYRISNSTVRVLALLHGARRWPERL